MTGFHTWPRLDLVCGVFVGLAAVAALATVGGDAPRARAILLVHACFLVSVPVSALLFVAVHDLASADWSLPLRHLADALAASLPAAALVLVAVVAARTGDVPADGHAGFGAAKAAYLSAPFVIARSIVILGAWLLLARLVRRASRSHDAASEAIARGRAKRWSAAFVVVFAISFTPASFDWLLSLEPRWVSTLFAWYLIAGLLALGVAVVALTAGVLRVTGRAPFLGVDHFHDLGRLVFAFSTFWAYLWFSQYLLTWYANLPEEVTHYAVRTTGAWQPIFWCNAALNGALPFVLLLSRAAKRCTAVLMAASASVVLGRWLDLYLIVLPAAEARPTIALPDIAGALGVVALIVLLTCRALRTTPLLPTHGAFLARGVPS